MEKEIWKDIKGYEGLYQVSNLGNVRTLRYRNKNEIRILKPYKSNTKHKRKYLAVCLSKNSVVTRRNIHRLVAETFIPNIYGKNEVNHIDGNKENNCVSNLEWCNRDENMQHAYKTGLI